MGIAADASNLVENPVAADSATPILDDAGGVAEGVVCEAVPALRLRWLERFFQDSLAPRIYRARLPIIIGFGVLTIPFTVYMLMLSLDEGGIQAFPQWHDQREYMDIMTHDGLFRRPPSYHDRGMDVQFVFGIKAADNGARYDKDDRGTLALDQHFDMDEPTAQTWLLETARQARRLPFATPAYLGPHDRSRINVSSTSVGEADCESSVMLAFDSEVASVWQVAACEAQRTSSSDGVVVVDMNFLAHDDDDDDDNVHKCLRHPDFCMLLEPKLIGRIELLWASGHAATAYTLQGAVRPGEWVLLSNTSGLSPSRAPKETVAVDWRPFSFIRLSFPRGGGGGVALAEVSVWGDVPSVIELVDMISRVLPSSTPCGGGLPLKHGSFARCAGVLARLQTSDLTGNVTGIPGGLMFRASDGRLVGMAMKIATDVHMGLVASWQYHKQLPNMHKWNTFLAERLRAAPPACKTAWLVTIGYLAAETQVALQRAIYQSGALALVIAFGVILTATRSLRVSMLATVAIATILAWTMGTVVAMGWKLGVLESTNIAILIGISVDFVVHFAHAFVHAPAEGREARVRYSLTTMGISVVAAAMTTLLAAMVLAMCTLTFFDKFGVFLCVTMVISLLLSIVFFQGLLGQFGPATHVPLGLAPLASALALIVLVAIVLLFVAFSGGFELVPGDASTA